MRIDLSKKSDEQLLTIFLDFRKFAKQSLHKRKKGWGEEIKKLYTIDSSGKSQQYDDTTIDNAVKDLRRANELDQHKVTKRRNYLFDLIVQGCETWDLEMEDEGRFKDKEDYKTRFKRPYHYLCYYWLQEGDPESGYAGVDVGYLGIFADEQNRVAGSRMELFDLYESESSHQDSRKPRAILISRNDNTFNINETIIIRLDDKENPAIRSQLSLYTGKNFAEGSDLPQTLVGTYTSIGRRTSQGQPICGMLYLEKKKTYEETVDAIVDPKRNIPDPIYHFLYGSRISPGNQAVTKQYLESSKEETELSKAYAGVYHADIVSDTKTNAPLHESLVLIIFPNSRAVIYVPDSNLPASNNIRTYHGRIRLVRQFNNNLVGSFDFSKDSKVSRFTLYIYRKQVTTAEMEPRSYGIYAGIEHESERLIAGSMRLTKTKLPVTTKPEELQGFLKSRTISENYFAHDPDLIKLFSRLNHEYDFIDTISSSQKQESQVIPGAPATQLFPFAGKYYLYALSSVQDMVARIPVEIRSDRSLHLYRASQTLTGYAEYDNQSILSLLIDNENKKGKVSHYLIHVENYKNARNLKHAFGISTRIALDGKPSARMELFVKAPEDWNASQGTTRFEINSEAFKAEDKKIKGHLSWLTGRYNRYIKAPRSPNEYHNGRQNFKYVDQHFYAACYLALRMDPQKELKYIVLNLYQAYLHGFKNIELLQKETSAGGALYNLMDKAVKNLAPKDDSRDIPPLTIGKIVEMISERAEYLHQLENPGEEDFN